jgi:hypothetical protein
MSDETKLTDEQNASLDALLTPEGRAKAKTESVAYAMKNQPGLTKEQAENLFEAGAELLGI